MIPKDLTSDIITRLKSIKGQIEGIIRMLDELLKIMMTYKILIRFFSGLFPVIILPLLFLPKTNRRKAKNKKNGRFLPAY